MATHITVRIQAIIFIAVLTCFFTAIAVTVTLIASSDPAYAVTRDYANQHLKLYYNDNGSEKDGAGFFLHTTQGNPEKPSDDNQKLLYGDDSNITSFTSIKHNNDTMMFGPEKMKLVSSQQRVGDTVQTIYSYNNLLVTQSLKFVPGEIAGRNDVLQIEYTLKNNSTATIQSGVRIMLDTQLGENDSAPFRVPGVGAVDSFLELTGSAIPTFWQTFDDPINPSVVAQGTLIRGGVQAPDRIQFTNWDLVKDTVWQHTGTPGTKNGDSAVVMYYTFNLPANQTKTIRTYYGLSGLEQSTVGPFSLAATAEPRVEKNGNTYQPNPITLQSYVTNVSGKPVDSAQLTYTLPAGIHFLENGKKLQQLVLPLGSFAAAQEKMQTQKIHVEPQTTARTFTYSVRLDTPGIPSNTVQLQLEVPALTIPNAPPVAQPGTLTTLEDTPKDIALSGSDPEGKPLTYSIVKQGRKGTISLQRGGTAPNVFVYSPALNQNGADEFTFRVFDGNSFSNEAVVKVQITPVNDAPTAQSGSLTMKEDTVGSGQLRAEDIEKSPLTYVLVEKPNSGTVVVNAATGAYRYTPNADYYGNDRFTFRVSDGSLTSAIRTVSITVQDVFDPPSFKIGDYVRFGTYNGQPIVWRVIHNDTNKNPILFADRIISVKAFDAAGPYHRNTRKANHSRVTLGSNFYRDSNLRQWLNSDQKTIDWIQNDPERRRISGGYNVYHTEQGFLADGNFSAGERRLIRPFTHRVILSNIDTEFKSGGNAIHRMSEDIKGSMTNYDSAYYQELTDRVFLLSVKQLKEYVFDRSRELGPEFVQATPTPQAVQQARLTRPARDQNAYLNKKILDENVHLEYWLNTPATGDFSSNVRIVKLNGTLEHANPHQGVKGVRPALMLDMAALNGMPRGRGTKTEPYQIFAPNR